MERHPNRESVIGLYLRDHLGTGKVRIAENLSTLVIVFCIDDVRGRLQHRLEVRQEVIADHDAEELENILDAQRVIERMREAGTESVVVYVSRPRYHVRRPEGFRAFVFWGLDSNPQALDQPGQSIRLRTWGSGA